MPMPRSESHKQNAREASLTAALLRQHRAVGRLIAGAKLVGHGAWSFVGLTFGDLIAAHVAAAKEPLMPRPKTVAR